MSDESFDSDDSQIVADVKQREVDLEIRRHLEN